MQDCGGREYFVLKHQPFEDPKAAFFVDLYFHAHAVAEGFPG